MLAQLLSSRCIHLFSASLIKQQFLLGIDCSPVFRAWGRKAHTTSFCPFSSVLLPWHLLVCGDLLHFHPSAALAVGRASSSNAVTLPPAVSVLHLAGCSPCRAFLGSLKLCSTILCYFIRAGAGRDLASSTCGYVTFYSSELPSCLPISLQRSGLSTLSFPGVFQLCFCNTGCPDWKDQREVEAHMLVY